MYEMDKKYRFTGETRVSEDGVSVLLRIQALKDFGTVKAGDLGGWIEKEENLSHFDNCWVYGNAWVSGNAQVYGNAKVYGDAWVWGNTKVYGDAQISGCAQMSGNARVHGDARVSDDARVYREAQESYFHDLFDEYDELWNGGT